MFEKLAISCLSSLLELLAFSARFCCTLDAFDTFDVLDEVVFEEELELEEELEPESEEEEDPVDVSDRVEKRRFFGIMLDDGKETAVDLLLETSLVLLSVSRMSSSLSMLSVLDPRLLSVGLSLVVWLTTFTV